MPVAPEEMGLYGESQLGICEKTAQLRRFCSLPGRVEDMRGHHLNRQASKMLRCYDYMPSSASAAAAMGSSMHGPRLQVRVDMDDLSTSPQTSPGSSSSDHDHYEMDQHLSSQGGQKPEPTYGLLDDNQTPLDVYCCDEFRMFEFKVRRCMRGRSHDWTECPFAHPGEKARRRDPRRYHYSGTACPDFRKGTCRRGDACEYAHGVFECWLHPARYRTQPCKDGRNCRRRVCFFAHAQDQLRLLPAAAAAASLSVLRSPASQPQNAIPALHSPSPSSVSGFHSPQPSPSSTPSLISAFQSPCSTPGVSSNFVSQFAHQHGSPPTSTLCCQGASPPPLSPPLSPSYSPPRSPPLSGGAGTWSASHPCDHALGGNHVNGRPRTLDRFHSLPPLSVPQDRPSASAHQAATIQAHRQLAMLQAAPGSSLGQQSVGSPVNNTPSGAPILHQQAANAAAMSDLLANLSAMNFHQNNGFWLQAQVAAAALQAQHVQKANMERAQFQARGGDDINARSQHMQQEQPSVASGQLVAALSANSGSMFASSPLPRAEKWGLERNVMDDLESNVPLRVESGRNLRAEVYAKLLKREDSHGSLVQADVDWVSDLVKEEEPFAGPAWDVWAHTWALNNLKA